MRRLGPATRTLDSMELSDKDSPGSGDPVLPDPEEFDWTDFRGIPFEELVAAAAVFKVLGTLGDAYLSRLGALLAEATPAILKKIRLRLYPVHNTGLLIIGTGRSTIEFVVDGDISDDAKLALIEMDLTADHLQGATLCWDAAKGQWNPV